MAAEEIENQKNYRENSMDYGPRDGSRSASEGLRASAPPPAAPLFCARMRPEAHCFCALHTKLVRDRRRAGCASC